MISKTAARKAGFHITALFMKGLVISKNLRYALDILHFQHVGVIIKKSVARTPVKFGVNCRAYHSINRGSDNSIFIATWR